MEPKESANFYAKHIDEANIYLPYIKDSDTVLDLGTGTGFPGIPLAVMKKEANFILVDRKKVHSDFLKEVKKVLELDNVSILNCRGEELKSYINEKVDIVCARAVSRVKNILSWAMPILKKEGIVLLGKGFNIEKEVKDSSDLPFELIESVNTNFGFLLVYKKLI